MSPPQKKIGLFGGTFDPIHHGHLRAALEVRHTLGLDSVLMIPSARPPHKDARKTAPAEDRLKMTRLAVEGTTGLDVSDVEYDRQAPSYTVETIEQLQNQFQPAARLFLILGLDAFREYDSWHRFRDLFKIVSIIVLLRPEKKVTTLVQMSRDLEDHLIQTVSDRYRYQAESSRFVHPSLQPVQIMEVTRLNISSSQIRRLRKTGAPIRFLLPANVEGYIEQQGLYT